MQMTSDILARGLWKAWGEAPLVVSDPLQARHLLGLDHVPPSAEARSRHQLGAMPVSLFRRAVPQLAPGALRELESLLTGGDLMFTDEYHNLVVNQGLDDLLAVTLCNGTKVATWFVGLVNNTPAPSYLPAHTMTSHTEWVETVAYSIPAARATWTPPGTTVTGQSTSNTASPASFTINATVAVAGSFLTSTSSGTGGRLYSAGNFSLGFKQLNNLDTLSVTATFTTQAA